MNLASLTLVSIITLSGCRADGSFRPDPNSGQIVWSVSAPAFGQPASDGISVFFGSRAHEVRAVDRQTGQQRWRVTTDSYSPATMNGFNVILAGENVVFGDYVVYGFDRTSGARRWTFDPQNQSIPGYGAGLYTLTTDGSLIFVGSGSGHAYAINAMDGTPAWIVTLASDDNTSVYDPVVDDRTVYFVVRHFTNPITGELVALDRASGALRWSHVFPSEAPTGSGPLGRVAPFGDVVFVANDDGKIYGFNKVTGAVQLTLPRRSDITGLDDSRSLTLAGSTLIVGSNSFFVDAYDASTGAHLWEANAGQGSSGNNPMATDGTTVYVPYINGSLGAIDVVTGRVRWVRTAPDGAS